MRSVETNEYMMEPVGWGTTYYGLYGEALPKRGTISRLQVDKRVGIPQVEKMKG